MGGRHFNKLLGMRDEEKVRRPSGLIKLPSELGGSSELVFYGDASLG